MISEYADPKETIRELRKALKWCRLRAAVYLISAITAVSALCYHQGYRQGCEDAINVVETKLDGLVKRLTGG